uniref:Uncharacterized protein n=1 Tax=Alexandrium andersonii TaxID=327968 RepID=A0A7S2CXZ9_9DINO|mmetsp:Transcript_43977/g.99848  ORF Transcript_43977/g.99848 Transcript_43977/m.99848 type:complete len:146 (+) Transcript_43977:86-523(+)
MSSEPSAKRQKTDVGSHPAGDGQHECHTSSDEDVVVQVYPKSSGVKRRASTRQLSDTSTASSEGEPAEDAWVSKQALHAEHRKPKETSAAMLSGPIGVFDWGSWQEMTVAEAIAHCSGPIVQRGPDAATPHQPRTMREVVECLAC